MAPRLRSLLVLACAALLASAPAAPAARVEARQACETVGRGECYPVPEVTYAAAGGEANDLSVSHADGRFVFRDVAPVEAGAGCESRSPNEVACVAAIAIVRLGDGDDAAAAGPLPRTGYPSAPRLALHGGDGADRIVAPEASVSGGEGDDELDGGFPVDGGPGDDTLRGGELIGGAGRDLLVGTDAANTLTGGADPDELRGEGGNDRLVGDGGSAYDNSNPAQPARDLLDGGEGADAVDYVAHGPPVTIDIARQTGGAEGEHDVLRGIESATGGNGDDVLLGDDGPNRLSGGGGRDSLHGAGGEDALDGDSWDDLLDGGDGNDRLYGDYGVDTLEGRAGDDSLDGGYDFDRVSGGDGDDVALGREGGPDLIECGLGLDVVEEPEKSFFQPDCEALQFHFVLPPFAPYPTERPDGRLVFKLPCPKPRACRGGLSLRLLGAPEPFAQRTWTAERGRARVLVALPRALRARRDEVPRVVVSFRVEQRLRGRDVAVFAGRWALDLRQTRR